MKYISLLLLVICLNSLNSYERKDQYVIGTYYADGLNIHGISIGLGSASGRPKREDYKISNTNGIKIEFIGAGILGPLWPRSPIFSDENEFVQDSIGRIFEKINGISVSLTGSICGDCIVNGISTGSIFQYFYKINGISASFFANTQIINGIQISIFNQCYLGNGIQLGGVNSSKFFKGIQIAIVNYSVNFSGIQIGLLNISKEYKGIQIGIWNINSIRSFPIINWNF